MLVLAQTGCQDSFCVFLTDRGIGVGVAGFVAAGVSRLGSVLLIILVAIVVRALAMGLIERYATRTTERTTSSALRSLSHLVREAVDGDDDAVPIAEVASVRKTQRVAAITNLAQSLVAVLIWTVATMMILSEFGIDLAPMIASAGIVGVALGFGAQDLVKDFLSGLFMLAEDQYGVGDVIDAGEAAGVVEQISLRTTSLRSTDGTLWHIPNGEIRRIGNKSQEWARALLDISVSYGTDIQLATDIIQGVADHMANDDVHRATFLSPPEVWGVEDLSADAIVLRLVIKTTPGDQFKLARELRRRIKEAFDEAGVEIPFQQRTIWVRNEPNDAAITGT